MCVEELGSQPVVLVTLSQSWPPEELQNGSFVGGGRGLPVHSVSAPQASCVLVCAPARPGGKQQANPVSC